ncbi:hypothetical protein HELRODRAFT_63354, partial [Helobdella robusta]|uniref:BK channel n=1 Tax=Helobdella robusta TaxID=6412 RepID=T1FXE7_HELRO
ISWFTDAKNWAREIVSAQMMTGQILVVLVLVVSLASLTIYFIDTYTLNMESCDLWSLHISWQVDLGCNIFFLVYFILQFMAASDKLLFWVEVYSIVDYFTIPPCILSVFLNRNWLGFRFLRVLRLMTVPDVLQFFNLLHSTTSTRLCQLVFTFISVWFAGSGFMYLLENSGDPFFNYENSQSVTFWQCIYFSVVTMSTVGYGDVVCRTILGQIFNVIFLLGGLAMFASFVPEIAEILSERSRYREPYKKERCRRHVVLCGHITSDSVNSFISDFLHSEREEVDVDVVIMNRKEPDFELQRILKKYYVQVFYIQGNVMNPDDLIRAQLKTADACLILADKYCLDVDAEDAANIMRVISVKNFVAGVKVIIQLLQYHSKTYLMNIPSWNWEKGDDAICLSELKLGFIAQSCLAPGFSTLMANLFTMRSYNSDSDDGSWLHAYKRGSGMEMYSIELSKFFIGMTFPEAAEICFQELKILLIAIEATKEDSNEKYIAINPGPSIRIEPYTNGVFVAQNANDVKIASYYCKYCLPGVNSLRSNKFCCGRFNYLIIFSLSLLTNPHKIISRMHPVCVCEVNDIFKPQKSVACFFILILTIINKNYEKFKGNSKSLTVECTAKGPCQFDSTGMFHWCPDQLFLSCVITRKEAEEMSNHIVVCLFAESYSPLVGLQNFVMPLRASNFHYEELKPIVIIGEAEYLRKEWKLLCNYPKLYMIFGSPFNRSLLRTVNINCCHACVILTAKKSYTEVSTVVDKEAILCSLNIQAMVFGQSNRKNLQIVSAMMKGVAKGSEITMITELDSDMNIKYVEQDDDDTPSELYLSQPFACGTAFTVSVLDSIMSTAYFNNNSLALIRTLITGGSTPDLEQILAEGMTLECGDITSETIINRERCKVTQFALSDNPFLQFSKSYQELFLHVLQNCESLCIGLYRVLNSKKLTSVRRYVITNPPADTILLHTDKVKISC